MDKFLKVQSVQGGEITSTSNLRDFHIPQGDVYDLRDSFVQFNCEISRVETVAGGGDGVYQNSVQWVTADAQKPHFPNVAFVKNCNLKSNTKGHIESIRRVDILKSNLAIINKSQRSTADDSYETVNQLPVPINAQVGTIFTPVNKTGAVKSIESNNVPLAIRCSDLFDFCSTDEYDTRKGGGLHMHMELNVDKLEAIQLNGADTPLPVNFRRFMNVATSAGEGNKIVVGTGAVPLRVQDLQQSPYYVGQKLLITATGTGTGTDKPADVTGTNGVCVIKSILWERGNASQDLGGKMTLEFESKWGASLAGDGGYTDVKATVAGCTPTLKITNAELVLKRKNMGELNNYSQIEYTTYTTEEGNGNARNNFQDLFTVEGDATQAFMCFAQGNDNLISSAPLTSFRCALNNQDITDRDVVVGTPLYYDRLAQTIRGQGHNLRNLEQNTGDSAERTYSNAYKGTLLNSKPLVASLFQTDSNKFLQVRATCGDLTYSAPAGAKVGVNDYQLFKSIPRVFSY